MSSDRIMSSETEWALFLEENGKFKPDYFFVDDTKKPYHVFLNAVPSPPRLESSSPTTQYYGNGARFYPDTGNHQEYAAPETRGAKNAVRYEKAGDRIIELAVLGANEHEMFRENGWKLRSFKNNKSIDGSTYGHHENYCVSLKKIPFPFESHDKLFRTLFHLIGPHLISRQLFAGNGQLIQEDGHLAYHLSQRAKETVQDIGNATTSFRAIINTRVESHADEETYLRLHVILSDSLMAETALFLTFGTTSLVLDMVESGFLSGKPFGDCDGLVNALHSFSADPTLRVAPNIGGKTYTVINVQEEYFKWANRFCESSGYTPDQRLVLYWWEKMFTLAKEPEPDLALAPFVDRAAKKMLIDKKLQTLGYDLSTPPTTELPKKIVDRNVDDEKIILLPEQIAARDIKKPPTLFHVLKSIDFQFHENSPRGLARILQSRGFLKRIVSDKETEDAVINPPQDTRAYSRTFWNKKLIEDGKDPSKIGVSWTQVKYSNEIVFQCFDPHHTHIGLKCPK